MFKTYVFISHFRGLDKKKQVKMAKNTIFFVNYFFSISPFALVKERFLKPLCVMYVHHV